MRGVAFDDSLRSHRSGILRFMMHCLGVADHDQTRHGVQICDLGAESYDGPKGSELHTEQQSAVKVPER